MLSADVERALFIQQQLAKCDALIACPTLEPHWRDVIHLIRIGYCEELVEMTFSWKAPQRSNKVLPLE
jgi:hypothetical protein